MKAITMTTENRINLLVKNNSNNGKVLLYLLNEMKSRESWLGATIKEMKEWGNATLSNDTQINVYEFHEFRSWDFRYNDLFSCVFCYDLHHVNVKDFNKLVETIYRKETE